MTPEQKSKRLKALRAKLATLTPNTPDWSATKYEIVHLKSDPADPVVKGATPGAPNSITPPKAGAAKAATVSFSYDEMVKKTGFAPTERNVKAMSKRAKTTGSASFISGGTPAQKKALAKKIANMTITSGMSAADAAKIRKARLWYTGQTGGRTGKGKAGDAKFESGSVKDQLVRGKKAGTPQKKTPGTKTPTVEPPGKPHVTFRGGTTADVAKQTAANAKVAPKSKTKAQKPFVRSPVNVKKPKKQYGGAFGVDPDSKTAGKGATEVPPAKKDRFRGRKSKSQTTTKALPGAVGSLEFATAAEARYNAEKEKQTAAKLLKKRQSQWKESKQTSGRKAALGGNNFLDSFGKTIDKIVSPSAESVSRSRSLARAASQGKTVSQASTIAAAKTSTAKKKKAARAEELKGFGYVPPKPKKRSKSSFGGGR